VDGWGADVLFFSAHKFFGPHLGIMVIRRELLEKIRFYKVVKTLGNEYMAETGTQNHEAIAALGATFDLLESLAPGATARERLTGAVRELAEWDDILADRLVEGLSTIPNVRMRRAPDPIPKTATVAFTATGRHPREIGEACSAQAVFVTDGEVYSNTLATLTGVSMRGGWVRAGLAPYLTFDDVDRGLAVIEAAVRRNG
jgi:selenocysteine lyase/cysteine desulfurase